MRIRTVNALDLRSERNIKIQFGSAKIESDNFFSVLVGENGTRKSQTLRDILDISFSSATRLRIEGRNFSGKSGELVYWSNRGTERMTIPSKIIAVSGVASDRFPSRLTSRLRSARVRDVYRYMGPKSDNNLISRAQSYSEIVRVIVASTERIPMRLKQIGAAFELLPSISALRFEFDRILAPNRQPWTLDSLTLFLKEYEPSKVGKFALSEIVLKEQCVRLLNSRGKIVFNLDSLGVTHSGLSVKNHLKICEFALECGAIRTSELYATGPGLSRVALADLSSGQWQILSSLLFVALAVEDDTLILIDEPENSLHPQWQREYLTLLETAISSCKGVHVVVATHSPLVASSLPPDVSEVIRLIRNRQGNVAASEVKCGPFGWTADDILEQVFGLSSTRSQLFSKEMDRALKLFSLGDRSNRELIRRVKALVEVSKSLPSDDIARSVISTLQSVVLVAPADYSVK